VTSATLLLLAVQCVGVRSEEKREPQEEVWGNPFKGVAISVTLQKTEYRLGEQIDARVRFKNFTDSDVRLLAEKHEAPYRVALFYSDGRPVPLTNEAKETEARIGEPPPSGRTSTIGLELPARQVSLFFNTIGLNRLFRIEAEGTYSLVVMYQLKSWRDGFAISNLVTLRVTGTQDKQASEPHRPEKAPQTSE
jgi:hypothetical protein